MPVEVDQIFLTWEATLTPDEHARALHHLE